MKQSFLSSVAKSNHVLAACLTRPLQFQLHQPMNYQGGSLYFQQQCKPQTLVLSRLIDSCLTSWPAQGIGFFNGLQQLLRKIFNDQNTVTLQSKKTILALNILLESRVNERLLNAYSNEMLKKQPKAKQFFNWKEQTCKSIGTLSLLALYNSRFQKHQQMCQAVQKAYLSPISDHSFRKVYSLACQRILPLKLPAHMEQVDAPLFICPLLSEQLYFGSNPNVRVEGQLVQSQFSFKLNLVTMRNVQPGQRLVFELDSYENEGLLRYGQTVGMKVRLVLDLAGFEDLAGQQYQLKSRLIKGSVLSVVISEKGIYFEDLKKLRAYCMTDEDVRQVGTKPDLQKEVTVDNTARVKKILSQSCSMALQNILPITAASTQDLRTLMASTNEEARIIKLFQEKL